VNAVIDAPTSCVLTPTNDPRPVEKAVIESLVDIFEPETLLWLTFLTPDGGARIWYAWTLGGDLLGDRVDRDAQARGLDLADWLHIPLNHRTESQRGRVQVQAFALRGIHADVLGGVRACDQQRDTVHGYNGESGTGPVGKWLGVGPGMLNRQWVTT
jgi:hypothetical protein